MAEAMTAAKYLKYLMLSDRDVITESAKAAASSVGCRLSWTEQCIDILIHQLQAERRSFAREEIADETLKEAVRPSLEMISRANTGLSNSMFYLASFNGDLQVHDVPEINFSDIPPNFQRAFPREKYIVVVMSSAVPGVLYGHSTLCYASAGVSLQPMWRQTPAVPAINAIGISEQAGTNLPVRKTCALTAIRRAFATLFNSSPDAVFQGGK
jgi:hypothetical protein